MPETQQSTGAGQNVSVSSARVWEEGQSMPPKTKHAGVRPHEMDKLDIAVFGRIPRVNADSRHKHGFVPPADVVLTDIRVLHITQESETERAEIKYCRGVLFNLENKA
jgi:Flp pilus assembly protein CpaB